MSSLNTYSDVTSTYLTNHPTNHRTPLAAILDQSPNQSEHTIGNNQSSNENALTKEYKVTESNAKNLELIKVIPPLKKCDHVKSN